MGVLEKWEWKGAQGRAGGEEAGWERNNEVQEHA